MTQLIKNIESYLVEEYLEDEENFMNYVEDDITGMLIDILENVVRIKNLSGYCEEGISDGKYNVVIYNCNCDKESHFEHRAWDSIYDFSENIVCCLKELKVI